MAMRDAHRRGDALGLEQDEVAFHDAIVQNDAAVLNMGDDTLKRIVGEAVRRCDWNLKDSIRAAMRAKFERLLTCCDFPPDKGKAAIELVLQQAKMLAMGNAL